MGETWEDRLDMAVSLAEVGVDSIPLNALMPIAGTPLEGLEHISEPDILRTVSFFRYIIQRLTYVLEPAGRCLQMTESLHSSLERQPQLQETCLRQ